MDINEGGSGSSTVKPIATFEPNGKGKGVHVEPTGKEKRILQELKIENMKQLNSINRLRENDPPDLDERDLNKVYVMRP